MLNAWGESAQVRGAWKSVRGYTDVAQIVHPLPTYKSIEKFSAERLQFRMTSTAAKY